MKMDVYLAILVFEIQTEGYRGKARFDEQVRWLEAPSALQAWEMAREMGVNSESVTVTEEGRELHWTFLCVRDLHALPSAPGEAIFSQTTETEEGSEYRSELLDQSRAALHYHQNRIGYVA